MLRRFRPYQFDAFKYARREQHPALFKDMRLGKTLVVIRMAKLYKPQNKKRGQRFLVVAPSSALGSWVEEFEKEEQGYTILEGSRENKYRLLKNANRWTLAIPDDCVNYELEDITPAAVLRLFVNPLGLLMEPVKNIKAAVKAETQKRKTRSFRIRFYRLLAKRKWDAVILDESTFIKNPSAQVTRFFAQNFREVPHRYILTGTPNPESDLDYFCQMQFLDGEFMGCDNYWKFRNKYFRTDYKGYGFIPRNGTENKIRQAIHARCFVLSRADAGMPDNKIPETRELELPRPIRKIYKNIEKEFMIEYGGEELVRTIWATTKYIWLRRLCGGWLAGNGWSELVWDGKIKELITLLQGELRRDPVVVWFNFNLEIDMVADVLRKKKIKFGVMRGDVPPQGRESIRKNFQAGKIRVLLVQQAIAQMGMNLSRADTAIYYSEPTGLLAQQQTEDRILDLSQNTPQLIIRLIVKDSVDEDNREALTMKGIRSSKTLSRRLFELMEGRHGKNK